MYSRRLGVANEEESRKSLEKFNHGLREQYERKRAVPTASQKKNSETTKENSIGVSEYVESAKGIVENLNIEIDYDTILIVGLILLLLTDADTHDLILLGVLVSLIL